VRSRGCRAPGPGRGRAAGGGEADEAAAEGACGRPSHAALRPWLSAAAAAACWSSTQEEWVFMFIRKVVNVNFYCQPTNLSKLFFSVKMTFRLRFRDTRLVCSYNLSHRIKCCSSLVITTSLQLRDNSVRLAK
jgi:hypothetical protein